MATNIYASELTPRELVIKMLREKNQIPFGLHDFNWVNESLVIENGRGVHKYTLEHKRKDIFAGQVVIYIKQLDKTTDPNTDTFINYDFPIEPKLSIDNKPLSEKDCLFGTTEALSVYNDNPALRLNYIVKTRVNRHATDNIDPIMYTIPINSTN